MLELRPVASIGWVIIAVLSALATSAAHGDGNFTLRCQPDQAASLLQLKKSFSFFHYPSGLESWQDGTDCCLWEGVGCSHSSGHVTALELSGRGLYSQGINPAIFNLTSLQLLDLSMNYFGEYSLLQFRFDRLPLLTHLNLSHLGFQGQIPTGIGGLINLISLDLSANYDLGDVYTYDDGTDVLYLQVPNFQILVANLNNLTELYLDGVDMSSSADWCHALAKYLPRLQVLSLSYCNLVGHICPSLSNLHSLTVINLQDNFDMHGSPFPELFMDFHNLSVLQLAGTNLQGWFPRRTFQSKTLRILDLSRNWVLSGHIPNFSNTSSLETMMLDGTDFSVGKPGSFTNFKSLQTLSLDVNFASMEPQSSLGIHRSLRHLGLTQTDSTSNLGLILSLIGDLQKLRSLELSYWDFSMASFSSVGKLKSLRRLSINDCIFTRSALSTFGNLVGLTSLEAFCHFNGPIPSAIGNMTRLKSLNIDNCDFLGPIPSSIGKLVNLRSLEIFGVYKDIGPIPSSIGKLVNLRSLEIFGVYKDIGPMPSAVGNLSNLESLEINDSEFSGPIPYAVGLLKKLTSLHIRNSGFSGSIPNSVSNLTRLIVLDLSLNDLKGELPVSVFTIPTLQHLDICSSQTFGSIQDINATSSHLVSVDLSRNNLVGNIPGSFFQLTSLAYLDIGWNNLVGSVDLSSFRRMVQLESLDLSQNQLFGDIPEALTNLTFLGILNLSNNQLVGRIPRSGQFATFENNSFEGNMDLISVLEMADPSASMMDKIVNIHYVDKEAFMNVDIVDKYEEVLTFLDSPTYEEVVAETRIRLKWVDPSDQVELLGRYDVGSALKCRMKTMPIKSNLHWVAYKEAVASSIDKSLEVFASTVVNVPLHVDLNQPIVDDLSPYNVVAPIVEHKVEVQVNEYPQYEFGGSAPIKDDGHESDEEYERQHNIVGDVEAQVRHDDMDPDIVYQRACVDESDDEGPENELDEDGFTEKEAEWYTKITGRDHKIPLFCDVSLADKALVDGGMSKTIEARLFPSSTPNAISTSYLKKCLMFEDILELKMWLCEYAVKHYRPFRVAYSDCHKRYTVKCEVLASCALFFFEELLVLRSEVQPSNAIAEVRVGGSFSPQPALLFLSNREGSFSSFPPSAAPPPLRSTAPPSIRRRRPALRRLRPAPAALRRRRPAPAALRRRHPALRRLPRPHRPAVPPPPRPGLPSAATPPSAACPVRIARPSRRRPAPASPPPPPPRPGRPSAATPWPSRRRPALRSPSPPALRSASAPAGPPAPASPPPPPAGPPQPRPALRSAAPCRPPLPAGNAGTRLWHTRGLYRRVSI
ncbi:Receptor-like protein 12 [Hordeum vulgare]|nr:Receptor-like protein 12 [Hordeum vulgare]